mmetsp:Transcript_6155/g.10237  ORF Transcript_6155/g.10237 Transcript_6155/m.10237 type:complete len:207 (+) Transcript_6155:105-725(+)
MALFHRPIRSQLHAASIIVGLLSFLCHRIRAYTCTWSTVTPGPSDVRSVAADWDTGAKVTVPGFAGYPYTSTDYGATYTQRTDPGNGNWHYNVVSGTGQYQLVNAWGGSTWYSNDYGVTWLESDSGSAQWGGSAMSYSGQYAIIGYVDGGAGKIKYSSDYGATWLYLGSFMALQLMLMAHMPMLGIRAGYYRIVEIKVKHGQTATL